MDYITVGEIVKAQGIKGEVKARALTDDSMRFKKLKVVYIGDKAYKIIACRIDGDFVFLQFIGTDTRDDAELLVGKFLQIDRINAIDLDESSFFIADIVGCKIFTEGGAFIGEVVKVDQNGAADVFTAVNGKATVRFPFLKRIISRIDVDEKLFIIKEAQFNEVCVYED